MQAEHYEKCKKKHGKKLFLILAIAGLVAIAAAAVPACGHRGCHKAKDPEKVAKFVQWRVDDLLDDLDANENQREKFQANADAIVADWMTMREDRAMLHNQVLAEMKKASPDAEVFKAMIDERMNEVKERAYRTVDSMLDAYTVLDANQKAEIVAKLEEHIEEHK